MEKLNESIENIDVPPTIITSDDEDAVISEDETSDIETGWDLTSTDCDIEFSFDSDFSVSDFDVSSITSTDAEIDDSNETFNENVEAFLREINRLEEGAID